MDQRQTGAHGGNIVLAKAGLAGSANNIAFNTTNNVVYTVDGVAYSKAAANNVAFSSGHTALAAGCECIFAVWVDSSGNITTTQGAIVDTASLSGGTGTKVVAMPDVVASKALIGLIKVKTAGAATFTPNTTAMNASNVTTTFYDTSVMPGSPLTS